MSHAPILELSPVVSQATGIRRGRVCEVNDGATVKVEVDGGSRLVDCEVLQTGASGLTLEAGDAVLVWLPDANRPAGVLLGRTGPYSAPLQPVVSPEEFASRPSTLVLEAQGDIVLRNGQAKIRLAADGEVEIVGASFTARCHQTMRLLGSLIKLN